MLNELTKYEKHPRDYTMVGITSIFQAFFQKEFTDFYGGTFEEIICLIKDGVFFHYQVLGDRERVSRFVLDRVNQNKIDLDKEFIEFDKQVANYEDLIGQATDHFTLQTILEFYDYYQKLIRIAFASMYTLDDIDYLNKDKRKTFKIWAEKVRRRSESIYKNGELKFIPRYMKWLQQNYLPNYSAKSLENLVFTELKDLVNEQKMIPTPDELEARSNLFYIRQFGNDEMEYFGDGEAEKIVVQKKLLIQKDNFLASIIELKGSVAFVGIVQGKVRIIRSINDIKDFQEGEIIVSPMTDPNYLSIMKKAKAFVTNEGGTLCHAAIVARELKKPCIIGTKYATHVFKDGDMVEVDAIKGIVKKI